MAKDVDLTTNEPAVGGQWSDDTIFKAKELSHLTCRQATDVIRRLGLGQADETAQLLLLHSDLESHESDCAFVTMTPEALKLLLLFRDPGFGKIVAQLAQLAR